MAAFGALIRRDEICRLKQDAAQINPRWKLRSDRSPRINSSRFAMAPELSWAGRFDEASPFPRPIGRIEQPTS
jgi:hypothetical protein